MRNRSLARLQLSTPWALLAALLATTTFAPRAEALTARFGVAPDNNQALLIDAIKSARSSLLINIYQLDAPAIVDAMTAQIRAGVTLKILIEGRPVGGITAEGKKAIGELQRAMRDMSSRNAANKVYIMRKQGDDGTRRYTYNHAKYVVVDSRSVYLASENFTASGSPIAGKKGNRGWATVITSSPIAAKLTTMFKEDSSVREGDVEDITANARAIAAGRPNPDSAGPRRLTPVPIASGTVSSAELITSPGSEPGLVEFIQSARSHLEIQQMSYTLQWKQEDGTKAVSPLIAAVIDAAHRGVKVRAIFNADDTFGGRLDNPRPGSNFVAAKFINTVAYCERVPIEARIISVKNLELTYVHNKGYLADDKRALVSSINGTRNSTDANRETALWLESSDAANYYGKVFDFDWKNSPETPGVVGRDGTRTPLDQGQCPARIDGALTLAPILSFLGLGR